MEWLHRLFFEGFFGKSTNTRFSLRALDVDEPATAIFFVQGSR
jgi:hypothetical protein